MEILYTYKFATANPVTFTLINAGLILAIMLTYRFITFLKTVK